MLPQSNNIYTYEEYLYVSKNKRCEFIAGQIYLMTSPNATHQRILRKLSRKLDEYFELKNSEPFFAPFDVELENNGQRKNETVQPDIVVIYDKHNINEHGRYRGTPTIVIEVVSPSNNSNDYITKLDLYMRSDVKKYWIVDARLGVMHVFKYQFENNDI